MDILSLNPRHGKDTLRLGDSDELVVMENFGALPKGSLTMDKHALIVICTDGMAQFDYDGTTYQLHKNDMFMHVMLHSVADNFMASADFNCHQIWFTRNEVWNVDMQGKKSITDLVYLKHHPKFTLTEADVDLLDRYFQLLCIRMRDTSPVLHHDLVRSLVGTMLLEILCIVRRNEQEAKQHGEEKDSTQNALHGEQLAHLFLQIVEQSDGRIRRVEEFARQLNVTPKYLSRLLRETLDRKPSDIISLYTEKAIEYRLRFTDMTMQQIADDLKFANPSFFGKYVKEHLGMTPLEYRLKYQREQE